jgi:hypothetical protein
MSSPFAATLLACVTMTQASMPAWAYRPFDGTDAAVAGPGEQEIELQPAGTLRQGSDKTLIAPAAVINIGLPDRWEAVFQGQGQFPLSGSDQPAAFTGGGAFLKHILRPGSLQNENGPSIATEFGALLPGINADAGFGASVAGIVSQRWEWGAVHFNSQTTLTRDHHADQFVSTILEGAFAMENTPRCGNLLRGRVWPIAHSIRAHRSHMAGSRRSGLRYWISSCADQRTTSQ